MYKHSSIRINNREIKLADIISEQAISKSNFERETFSFIKQWLEEVPSFILNTSGSTGTPKEITLSRDQLKQSAKRTLYALKLKKNDTALVCLDTKYIAGKMMLARALEGDMHVVATEPSANPIQKISIQADFAAFVPLQLEEMLTDQYCIRKLHEFNCIIVGGAAIHESLKTKIKSLSCAVYATYGMTETVSHIALQKLNGHDATEYFTLLDGITVYTDSRGCLIIQMPEFETPIVTNDLVEIIDSKKFRWLGRYDLIVNSGGVKIFPEKVEKLIGTFFQQLNWQTSFFVAGIPDERLGQKLVLVIEGDLVISKDQIASELKKSLPPYEIPKEIFTVSKFIRTKTGKINRSKTIESLFK